MALEDAHRFIGMATGTTPNLLIAVEVMGEAVGGIAIHPLDDVKRRSAEIGYWLYPVNRGIEDPDAAYRAAVSDRAYD